MSGGGEKRPVGRPRKYLDDADRARAHRERVADELADAEMLRVIFDRPTAKLIANLAEKYARMKDDKAKAGADLTEALLMGLAAGGGANCAQAGVNFARYDFQVARKSVGAGNGD